MPTPTSADLESLKATFKGLPFNRGTTAGILGNLKATNKGLPFNANPGASTTSTLNIDDSLFLDDTPIVSYSQTIDDSAFLDDGTTLQHVIGIDDSAYLDDITHLYPPTFVYDSMELDDDFVMVREVEDSLFLDDEFTFSSSNDIVDETFIADAVSISFTRNLDDSTFLADSVTATAFKITNIDDSMFIADTVQQMRRIVQQHGAEIQIARFAQENYAAELALAIYDTGDVGEIDNPTFDPTIVIDGVPVNIGASTDPGTYNEFLIVPSGTGISGDCNIQDFSINLTLGGGSFELSSKNSIGTPGGQIILAGLKFIITDHGPYIQGSRSGFQARGIFGNSRELNRSILLTATSSELTRLRGLFPAFPIQSPPSNLWGSVIEAAQSLAGKANINFAWQTANAPLLDAFVEAGMKVGDALRSLASRVGGILTFDGTTWVVIDPERGFGGWLAPTGATQCNLINGASASDHLDLEGDIVVIPIDLQTQVPTVLLPDEVKALNKKRIEILHTTTRRPKVGEPATVIDCPGDFKNPAYMQIIAENPGEIPNSVADTAAGRDTWSAAGLAIEEREYGKKQIVINRSDIPAECDGKKFRINFGYVRNIEPRETALSELQAQALQKKKLLLQSQQESMRYFQKRTGQMSMIFYGTLPIPGNKCVLNYSDGEFVNVNVSGIVTSVNYTGSAGSAALLQVQVAQFVKLNMQTPQSILDRFMANHQEG